MNEHVKKLEAANAFTTKTATLVLSQVEALEQMCGNLRELMGGVGIVLADPSKNPHGHSREALELLAAMMALSKLKAVLGRHLQAVELAAMMAALETERHAPQNKA